jgi:membrane protease YdiL (CAAX protease family)
VIIIALLPAIGEEVCFRSILQRIIIQITRNAMSGILITAFIFSALHFQFEGFLPRMFLGFMLGYLYWYSGSIWTSMLAHFVNNAVQVVVVSYAPQYISETPVLPLLLVITSGVTVAAILWFYQQESRQRFTLVYGEPGGQI